MRGRLKTGVAHRPQQDKRLNVGAPRGASPVRRTAALVQIESANCEITAGFSTVDVSCVIDSPFATERNKRRTTLPERVFGMASPKRMSFGFAIGPISLATHARNSSAMRLASAPVGRAAFRHDEGDDGLTERFIGTPDDRRFGDERMAASADSISIVPIRCPDTFRTSSMRPVIVK